MADLLCLLILIVVHQSLGGYHVRGIQQANRAPNGRRSCFRIAGRLFAPSVSTDWVRREPQAEWGTHLPFPARPQPQESPRTSEFKGDNPAGLTAVPWI